MKRTVLACVASAVVSALIVVALPTSHAQERGGEAVLRWEPVKSQTFIAEDDSRAEPFKNGVLKGEAVDGGWEINVPTARAKVPGGWFVHSGGYQGGPFFYPDPEHTWDGSSLR